MGQVVSKLSCMNCANRSNITDKELTAVREVISSLRENVEEIGHGWLFRPGPAMHHQIVAEMVASLERGQARNVQGLLADGFRVEAAQALYVFLSNKGQPLLPPYIQSLALDADNSVHPEIIAMDVLGLMKQDLPPKKLELLIMLLHLLDTVIKYSPADELRGCTLPLSMLPLFFNIQNNNLQDWRRIVMVFVELIHQAAADTEVSEATTESSFVNVLLDEEIPTEFLPELERRNHIIRRFIAFVGYRGDCNNVEVIFSSD